MVNREGYLFTFLDKGIGGDKWQMNYSTTGGVTGGKSIQRLRISKKFRKQIEEDLKIKIKKEDRLFIAITEDYVAEEKPNRKIVTKGNPENPKKIKEKKGELLYKLYNRKIK